jgi:RND family efflux transporter MFP subunit
MTERGTLLSLWGCGHQTLWGLLLMALVLFGGCEQKSTFTPPPPPTVTVSQPVERPVTDYLELTGNTQAVNTVQLVARVQGVLEKVLFRDGDRVKKGQLLFLIQQNTYQAQLQQAEADILAQKANLDHAETEFARYSNLLRQKAAAQTDVDLWRYNRDSARAALLAAEARRSLAKLDLDYTRVAAPFDGRIDRRLKDPGNLVGSGQQTVLAEINQIDPIYVYFTINERDLLRLRVANWETCEQLDGKKCPIYCGLANENGTPHQGSLDFAAINITPTTGTLLLRGIFPNPDGKILAGLYARVRVPVAQQQQAILVPQVAVGFDQQGFYVLVVDDKNLVERRGVTLGTQVDDLRVVEEGLKSDEWVVVNGLLRAMPGRPVTPQKQSPAAPANQEKATAGTAAVHGGERSATP